MISPRLLLGVPIAALLAACSASPTTEGSGAEPRTVEVRASDEMRFDPSEISVTAAETVRFVVTNEGNTDHEFLIGTEAEQAQFAEEMAGGDSHAHTDVGVTVGPDKTETFEYTFDDDEAELWGGCHQPGHYEAGMVASITVTD